MKRPSNKKNKRSKPTIQEEDFANRVQGKRLPGSGAYRSSFGAKGSGYKGDVSSDDYLFEMKQTDKKSMSLKLDWLNKISIGARPKGKKPALHLRFNNADIISDKNWVLIEESTFLDLINDAED